MHFRSCCLTKMEQPQQLLRHHIAVQIYALAASGLRECVAVPFRITAVPYHQGQVVGTLRSFETSVIGYQSTRRNNPENINLQQHSAETVKCRSNGAFWFC